MESGGWESKGVEVGADRGVRGLDSKGEKLASRSSSAAEEGSKRGEGEDPAQTIINARKSAADPNVVPQLVGKTILVAWLITRLMNKILLRFVSPKAANQIIRVVTMGTLLWKTKAPSKVNTQLPNHVLSSWPVIGSLIPMLMNSHNIHEFILRTVERAKFQSFEITIPGVHMLLVMDPRDREYVLRGHFANYTKNLPGEMNSFETAFSELFGRGIFAVDGAEWKDHRKIGKL